MQAAVAWLNQKPGVVAPVELRIAFLYNPGLENTRFTSPACNGSLVATTAMS